MDNTIVKLCCGSCNKPLMNYWVTVPQAPLVTKIKATCPFCGQSSFEKKIAGKFYYGPIGKDQATAPTVIDDQSFIESDPPSVTFYIKKGAK